MKIRDWVGAMRLRTLPAAIVPVAVGTAVAAATGKINWKTALAALGGSIAIQIGTNFANDVYDAEKGADGPDRIGPVRAVSAGLISPRAMKIAMYAAFGVATLFGGYLVLHGGWPIVAIGLASIASGIAYTGGPYPLGYNGLGDVFVMGFFGFVAVCGTAYVQLGRVPGLAIAASIPVGALATAILVVNNLRDVDTDVKVGKRTLAVRYGRAAAIAEYGALLASAYLVPAGIAMTGRLGALLPLVTAPMAIARFKELVAASDGPSFNKALGSTAKLLIAHGLTFAIGLASKR